MNTCASFVLLLIPFNKMKEGPNSYLLLSGHKLTLSLLCHLCYPFFWEARKRTGGYSSNQEAKTGSIDPSLQPKSGANDLCKKIGFNTICGDVRRSERDNMCYFLSPDVGDR